MALANENFLAKQRKEQAKKQEQAEPEQALVAVEDVMEEDVVYDEEAEEREKGRKAMEKFEKEQAKNAKFRKVGKGRMWIMSS